MNKLYKENGLLSSHGENVTYGLSQALSKLLSDPHISEMSEHELRTFGGALQKIVGDAISNKIQAKKDLSSRFAAMSDEQFEGFLKVKYGPRWILVSMTPEELDRAMLLKSKCTGHLWHDEYGNESFQHDDFTYCPVHDR